MSIQILGLREVSDGRRIPDFFHNKWRAPSVAALMQQPDLYLASVPEHERVNIYFTVHQCFDKFERDFSEQWCVPFDIDNVKSEEMEQVLRLAIKTVGADYNKVASICSGNGVQFFIPIETAITDKEYFTNHRFQYKDLCSEITVALEKAYLSGNVDTTVFSLNRLMRMPNTINQKKGKADTKSHVFNGYMEPHGWTLESALIIPGKTDGSTLHLETFKKMRSTLDTVGVITECLFLKHCKDNSQTLSEPEWYGMQGVMVHLDGGMQLIHDYSKDYKGYSQYETQVKSDQASRFGPRTCANIDTLWKGCSACPHFKKLASPCHIQSTSFIKTEGSGFWNTYLDKRGKEVSTPAHEDIVKFFHKEHGKTITVNKGISYYHSHKEKIWTPLEESYYKSFVYNIMKPKPRSPIVQESWSTIGFYDSKDSDFFAHAERKVNLNNGVYDIITKQLVPHSPDFGFRNKLDFDYDPTAKCPVFSKFLTEVTCGDKGIADLLMEYIGYAISGDSCFLQKGIMLIGEGSNGKSTINKVVKKLIGQGNYSTVTLSKLNDPQFLAALDGSLVNIADENKDTSLLESEIFKSAIAGDELMVKQLYSQPYIIQSKAKFIINCNSIPVLKDKSYAMYRRIELVPFNAKFEGEDADLFIEDKLYTELPGIFNMAMEAYVRLKANLKLSTSSTLEEMKSLFMDCQNDSEEWAGSSLAFTENAESFVSFNDLYQSYLTFCDLSRVKFPQSKQAMAFFLSKYMTKHKSDPIRARINGAQVRGFNRVNIKKRESLF